MVLQNSQSNMQFELLLSLMSSMHRSGHLVALGPESSTPIGPVEHEQQHRQLPVQHPTATQWNLNLQLTSEQPLSDCNSHASTVWQTVCK
jgi:hypothetical protein